VKRALFVSNGHGEAAIADRIAVELNAIAPGLQLDHLALVGDGVSESLHDVGPARAMPSGGLIAMGNVRNIARDVRSGLLGLTLAQFRFLRGARGRYDAAAAIGDTYALLMASIARAPDQDCRRYTHTSAPRSSSSRARARNRGRLGISTLRIGASLGLPSGV